MFVFFMMVLPYFIIPGFFIYLIYKYIKECRDYKASAYYEQTKTPYLIVRTDKGKFGEYLTYSRLKDYEKDGGKFLFNVYIPKGRDETTEIDVLLVTSKGIFVFESKNYSGWIFGDETQRKWTQTLPQGRGRSNKEYFYNPIMQNRTHIKHLQDLVGKSIPMKSIIVFSERCTLKNIKVNSEDVRVVNRYDVASAVSSLWHNMQSDKLSGYEINHLFNVLYPFTQVNQAVKDRHNENIKKTLNS